MRKKIDEQNNIQYSFKYVFNPNSNIDINEVIKSSFLNVIRQNKY